MAIRRIGSRLLVVDGMTYRWRIRRRATNSHADYSNGTSSVAVEAAGASGAVLLLETDRPHPASWSTGAVATIFSSDVSGWVRSAIRAGWMPGAPGAQLHLRASGSSMRRCP